MNPSCAAAETDAIKQHRFPDYEALSKAAAEHIFETLRRKPDASVCLPTGSTPKRTYEILAEMNRSNGDVFKSARIVKLDEWSGLEENHPATCEFFLQERVLEPLGIGANQYISFKSNALDPVAECARVQKELDHLGSIDLCILGLGANGHLGFNEPAKELNPMVHLADLADRTRQHSMVADEKVKPKFGYTLGMAQLLGSKQILILVSGAHKKEQLRRLLEPTVETEFPASFLWLHPNVLLFCDQASTAHP
jgi:galactosamine-6-phosphate isomerase